MVKQTISMLTSAALVAALFACSPEQTMSESVSEPAPKAYPNLFTDYLGKTEAEVQARLDAIFQQTFYGDDETERLYFPVEDDMAYIYDFGSGDVRSEGMSYGMMVAVQLDKKEEFDRLWKWTHTYMRHNEGPREGYFAWHCDKQGNKLDPGSASDGEEWFAMSLFFAAGRWGNGEGIFDYEAEANKILHAMLYMDSPNQAKPDLSVISMFDHEDKQIRFVPYPAWTKITDPSYHLPAFYELWALWAENDKAFWADAAEASREHFRNAAHPRTGLMPDYAHFDGTPFVYGGHEHFKHDAWRTLANVAIDFTWWEKDPWQVEQSNRVLSFLSTLDRVPEEMTLEGEPLSEFGPGGLLSMCAVAALAADPEIGKPWVQDFWDMEVPTGQWRYYSGMLYLLGYLQVSGHFQSYPPQ